MFEVLKYKAQSRSVRIEFSFPNSALKLGEHHSAVFGVHISTECAKCKQVSSLAQGSDCLTGSSPSCSEISVRTSS